MKRALYLSVLRILAKLEQLWLGVCMGLFRAVDSLLSVFRTSWYRISRSLGGCAELAQPDVDVLKL